MKKIDEQVYKTRFPNNNENYFNKLTASEKDQYLFYVVSYYNLLIQFLIKNSQLDQLDNIFAKSKNNFNPVSLEEMDLYQYLSSDYLKYLYIRNNVYIENLTESEKEELIDLVNKYGPRLTEENSKFIQKTLGKVISENQSSNTYINFGPNESSNYFAPSNVLVIGVRFDDFKDFQDVDWSDKNFAREQELDFALQYIESAISNKLKIETKVIRYRDTSVEKIIEQDNNRILKN